MSLSAHDVAQPGSPQRLTAEQVGMLLGAWKARELQLVRRSHACADLTEEQLEDLYQDTTAVLLVRGFADETQLRDALRAQIPLRALQHHRDERNHRDILARHSPGIQTLAQARANEHTPEQQLLDQEDRLVVDEFLGELTPLQREIFWWATQSGRSTGYNRIARRVGRTSAEVRRELRAIEQTRERFVLLYSRGRLCGYRAQTIRALIDGQATSAEQARRAITHLRSCRACQVEHRTSARALEDAFAQQVAAVLVPPLLAVGRIAWPLRASRSITGAGRRVTGRLLAKQQGLHDRLAVLYNGGANSTSKLARAAALTVLAAGGTLTATQALTQHTSHKHHTSRQTPVQRAVAASPPVLAGAHSAAARPASRPPRLAVRRPSLARVTRVPRTPGYVVPLQAARPAPASRQYESGGFAYLGVPPPRRPATRQAPPVREKHPESNGGEFSP